MTTRKRFTITATDSDGEEDVLLALKAYNLKLVIEELREELRSKQKYEGQEAIDITELRNRIWEIIEENNVTEFFS